MYSGDFSVFNEGRARRNYFSQ